MGVPNKRKTITSVCSMTSEQAAYGFKRLADYVRHVAKNQRKRSSAPGAPLPIARKARKMAVELLRGADDNATADLIEQANPQIREVTKAELGVGVPRKYVKGLEDADADGH